MSDKASLHCGCGGVLIHVETVPLGFRCECQWCGEERVIHECTGATICVQCISLFHHEGPGSAPFFCPECEPKRSRLAS